MKQLLSKADVAKMLGCCPRTVDNLRASGLPYHNIGRLIRFDESEVRSWAGLPMTRNDGNDSGGDGNGHGAGKGGRQK